MNYTFSKIAKILSNKFLIKNDCVIKYLTFDSRLIHSPENTLFFAIKGNFNDGHNFINELYKNGMRNFCINSYFVDYNNFNDANFIIVSNTISALQNLAEYHRKLFDIPVIAITGSNGKTIVKEWLKFYLSKSNRVVCSPKSYNSQIGVPLSVWEMNSNHEIAIFEAGISMPGEMSKLERIIMPNIGVFTNIGDAHQENFLTLEQKIEEKMKLFANVQKIIYPFDCEIIKKNINKISNKKEIFGWSLNEKCDLQLIEIIKNINYFELLLLYKNKNYKVKTKLNDKASIENMMSVISMLLVLNPETTPDKYDFLEVSPVEMRLQQIQGVNNCTIINDTYNSDLTSLRVAIEVLNTQNQHKKRTLILSDILQIGKNEFELYSEIATIIKNSNINRFIGIGNSFSTHKSQFEKNSFLFETTFDFLSQINKFDFNNEAILIKGSRKFNFESITEKLQQKNHYTVLEINIPALENNLLYFRNKIKTETKLMIMLKAFSYGSGTYEIANWLQRKNIDYIAVAISDEGFELKKAGITTPIMVLNPDSSNFSSYSEYNLEPEIYNFRVLKEFYNSIKDKVTLPYPIHLKINTGMNRLGFNNEQIFELTKMLKNMDKIFVKSVFSHLVGSSEEIFDDFTKKQYNLFINSCEILQKELGYSFIKHILNSGGIERFPQFQLDMVRLGIGLYGISSKKANLKNISSLKTRIIHIQRVSKEETIGYSRKGKLQKESIIATIPIGYADGLNRHLSNGVGYVIVNGQNAPIIGNICMDLTMIDITNIENIKEGDEVTIFGEKPSISELADKLQTIPYEILTSISQRVKRIYLWE